jgi:hypothetical protein
MNGCFPLPLICYNMKIFGISIPLLYVFFSFSLSSFYLLHLPYFIKFFSHLNALNLRLFWLEYFYRCHPSSRSAAFPTLPVFLVRFHHSKVADEQQFSPRMCFLSYPATESNTTSCFWCSESNTTSCFWCSESGSFCLSLSKPVLLQSFFSSICCQGLL